MLSDFFLFVLNLSFQRVFLFFKHLNFFLLLFDSSIEFLHLILELFTLSNSIISLFGKIIKFFLDFNFPPLILFEFLLNLVDIFFQTSNCPRNGRLLCIDCPEGLICSWEFPFDFREFVIKIIFFLCQLLFLRLQLDQSIRFLGWESLELLQITLQYFNLRVQRLYFLLCSLLSFLWEFKDFESFLQFLFQERNRLCIFLWQFDCQFKSCSLVGQISWQFIDFIIQDLLVIMGSFQSPIELIILMLKSNKRLISC